MAEGPGDEELAEAAGAFSAGAAGLVAEPLGSGHIHRTWLATWRDGGAAALVLQRLNTRVFPDTAGLMQNLERVTSHLTAKLRASGASDAERRALRPVAPREGGWLHRGRCANALIEAALTDAGGGARFYETPVCVKE